MSLHPPARQRVVYSSASLGLLSLGLIPLPPTRHSGANPAVLIRVFFQLFCQGVQMLILLSPRKHCLPSKKHSLGKAFLKKAWVYSAHVCGPRYSKMTLGLLKYLGWYRPWVASLFLLWYLRCPNVFWSRVQEAWLTVVSPSSWLIWKVRDWIGWNKNPSFMMCYHILCLYRHAHRTTCLEIRQFFFLV